MKRDLSQLIPFLLFFAIRIHEALTLIPSVLNTKVELAPASLQPLPDLSLVPPADTPEAAFDMIAAANLQPAATLELDSTPDQETEEPAVAEELQDTSSNEPEENEDEEEIPLEEVHSHHCTFREILCCSSFELPHKMTVEVMLP